MSFPKLPCKSAYRYGFLSSMFQDIRYSIRVMLHNKAWTVVAVLSLAIGIGANTALFSLIDAALLRKLPVSRPAELVLFRWSSGRKWPARAIALGAVTRNAATNGVSSTAFSYETFKRFRSSSKTLSNVFGFAAFTTTVSIDGVSESVSAQLVSGNYYGALEVPAIRGRTILDSDDQPSSPPVAVISYRYWQRRFALDPGVLGKTVTAGNNRITIIGVTPQGFDGAAGFGTSHDFSLPLSVERSQIYGGPPLSLLDTPWTWWVTVMGRTNPGITLQQVKGEMEGVFQASALETYQRFPGTAAADRPDTAYLEALPGSRGLTKSVQENSRLFIILISTFGLLLLLACINAANLLLAGFAARRQEISVRIALGAARMRVVRQFLTESILLALISGLLGAIAAYWMKDLVALFLPSNSFSVVDLSIDYRVLGFTFLASSYAGVLFGVFPAMLTVRSNADINIKNAARTVRGGQSWFGRTLIVVQVSALVLLLAAAGLFIQTLYNLESVNVGFDTHNLLMLQVKHRQLKYDDARAQRLYSSLLERLRSIPGVVSVTTNPSYVPIVATDTTIRGNTQVTSMGLRTNNGWAYEFIVGANFFKTLRIPILKGRDFGNGDSMDSPKVAIINETLAKESFPGSDPIGQHIRWFNNQDIQIVGVVKDVKHELRATVPAMYKLDAQFGLPYSISLDIRTCGRRIPQNQAAMGV
jgi:predicted permease